MMLTAMHMLASMVLCSLVLLTRPSAMPGVEKSKGQMGQLMKYLCPIGFLFAIMLYGSNRAYLYCSVAFLQFMKEANVVLVFTFSALAGLQFFTRQRVVVIAWVILGSSLCVHGERVQAGPAQLPLLHGPRVPRGPRHRKRHHV